MLRWQTRLPCRPLASSTTSGLPCGRLWTQPGCCCEPPLKQKILQEITRHFLTLSLPARSWLSSWLLVLSYDKKQRYKTGTSENGATLSRATEVWTRIRWSWNHVLVGSNTKTYKVRPQAFFFFLIGTDDYWIFEVGSIESNWQI